LLALIETNRLVTIVGTGGVGKTTVALNVAAEFGASHREPAERMYFVDLAPVDSAESVCAAFSKATGLGTSCNDLIEVSGLIRDCTALIVVDNCEHVVGAAARAIEQILRDAPKARVLATSREPLRAEGEWIQRLQPLSLPPHSESSVQRALSHSAVELFVERAGAASGRYRLLETEVESVTRICRRLDGIPLAIELAAVRVEALGVRGVEAALDDAFALLSAGRRTAMPRQRTLRATLDWSYLLLQEKARFMLHQLSVFPEYFSMVDAREVVVPDPRISSDFINVLSDLSLKSLLITDRGPETTEYRMLGVVRDYASEKLSRQMRMKLRRRHALYVLRVLETADAQYTDTGIHMWLVRMGRHVGNVRAAMGWASSNDGDPELAVKLVMRSTSLLHALEHEERRDAHVAQLASIRASLGSLIRRRGQPDNS
jgi:predicted ATPase